MEKEKILIEIEKILDKWDPLGILQGIDINYFEGVKGEYFRYINPIIKVYLSNQSIYNYLSMINAELICEPNKIMKKDILYTSKKLEEYLDSNKEYIVNNFP